MKVQSFSHTYRLCSHSYLRMVHFTNAVFVVHHFGFLKLFLLLHCHLILLSVTFKTSFSVVLKRRAVGFMMFANTSKPSTDAASVLLGQLRTTRPQGLTE